MERAGRGDGSRDIRSEAFHLRVDFRIQKPHHATDLFSRAQVNIGIAIQLDGFADGQRDRVAKRVKDVSAIRIFLVFDIAAGVTLIQGDRLGFNIAIIRRPHAQSLHHVGWS